MARGEAMRRGHVRGLGDASPGNNFKRNTFLQRAFGPATGMLRLVYNN